MGMMGGGGMPQGMPQGMGGVGCQGGSYCQAPMFQGINQQLMFQRQMQMLMMQQQMMQQPRLGMSVRVCTCPQGTFSANG